MDTFGIYSETIQYFLRLCDKARPLLDQIVTALAERIPDPAGYDKNFLPLLERQVSRDERTAFRSRFHDKDSVR